MTPKNCPCQGHSGTVLVNMGDGGCSLAPYTCSYCDGTGIDQRDPKWVEAGKRQRKARLTAGQTWMDWSRIWGVPPIELSDMERGLRQPFAEYMQMVGDR